MPSPRPKESEKQFKTRCIPFCVKEGLTQKQADRKCTGLWEQFNNKKPKSKTEMKAIHSENSRYF